MHKIVTAAIATLALSTTWVHAETAACDPAKLSTLIDRYAAQPFSALNWRVLNGMGDPGVEPAETYDNSWQDRDEYRKLAQTVVPSAQQEIGYDCRASYPLSVLRDRIAKFGATDPYVVQWVNVQGQVFQSCSGSETTAVALPEPLTGIDATRETLQRADRAYQSASLAFYKDKTKALELFKEIAATDSPHKAAARYNIANILANAKQVDAARNEANAILSDPSLSSVHTITKQLLGYIANLEDTAAGWSALINDAITAISLPTADILSSPDHRAEFARALADIDYAGVRAKSDDWWVEGTLPENPTLSKAIVDASRQSPMALWMMGGQSLYTKQQALPWSLRGQRWQGYAGSYFNKVMAISPSGQQVPALPKSVFETLTQGSTTSDLTSLWTSYRKAADAAASTCGAAPETAALSVMAEQTMFAAAAQGKFDDIYTELLQGPLKSTEVLANRLLPQLTAYLLSTGNVEEGRRLREKLLTPAFFAALPENYRQQTQDSMNFFLAWVAEDKEHWLQAVQQNRMSASAPLLNYVSDAELWRLSDETQFKPELRKLFARVAWTREYATQKATSAASWQKLMASDSTLKASSEQLKKDYPQLSDTQHQLLFVLRNPRLGIMVNAPAFWSTDTFDLASDASYTDVGSGDHNDRNWWCPLELDRHLGGLRTSYDNDARLPWSDGYGFDNIKALIDPELRSKADEARETVLARHPVLKSVDWKKVQQLANMPSAPKKLSLAAIAWAKGVSSKQGDAAAEALASAVMATRYGCNWHGGHKAYSKQAQELLVGKFSTTSFAAQTPYWFDCMDHVWNDKGEKVPSCKPRSWPKQTIPGRK